MALLLVELGPQAGKFLRILGLLVAFSRDALPFPLLVVESVAIREMSTREYLGGSPLAVLLLPPLDVPGLLAMVLVGREGSPHSF